MNKNSKITVFGSTGLVGSAIKRELEKQGYKNVDCPTRKEVDLLNDDVVKLYFSYQEPEYVFLAAAKVGGIHANSAYPADFITQNLVIQTNVLKYSHEFNVKRLLFLGSSCIYPPRSDRPIKESDLLNGELEPTNDAYAIAKITGIKMCEAYNKQYGTFFLPVMPCNLYGVGDNYHPENSHVIPALIRKFHQAKERGIKEVEIWGDGTPLREFLYSDDLANACVFLMNRRRISPELINIGSTNEMTISDLVQHIAHCVGYSGTWKFNPEKPNGAHRKKLDTSKINALGWHPMISFNEGLNMAYRDYKDFL